MKLKILALEPFYGGSHKYFIDSWIKNSIHDFDLITLSDKCWMWRSQHSAVSFAQEVKKMYSEGKRWDVIFCTDMLNLPQFIGLLPCELRSLPTIIYFHENQLAYPVRNEQKKNREAIFANFASALSATEVWFNSAFNRDSFLNNLPAFFNRMPDKINFENEICEIRNKSKIKPLGISIGKVKAKLSPTKKVKTILWAARWELDKNPRTFFNALKILKKKHCEFRINVIGEVPVTIMPEFLEAEKEFETRIDHWGYMPTREKYLEVLGESDIFVSTAKHEFFGITALEASLLGCYPLLPTRLAYPEIWQENNVPIENFFYNGHFKDLANKLYRLLNKENLFKDTINPATIAERYNWNHIAIDYDTSCEKIFKTSPAK